MMQILDYLQVILWTVAYIEIVIVAFKYREDKVHMPYVASVLNPAWDINSMVMPGLLIGRAVWLVLDAMIFAINAKRLKNKTRVIVYVLAEVLTIAVLRLLFTAHPNGMIYCVFSVDLIMAVDYIVERKRISAHGQVPIAATKLLADFFAWIAYMDRSRFAAVVGGIVFLVNLFYLAISMQIAYGREKQQRKGGR